MAEEKRELLIYPLILICMMLFRPQGLLGTAELSFFKIPGYFKALGNWFKKIFSKKIKHQMMQKEEDNERR